MLVRRAGTFGLKRRIRRAIAARGPPRRSHER
jgi:hypothetical protein